MKSRMTKLDDVLVDVAAERARQDLKWGGALYDDTHTPLDWYGYRVKFEHALAEALTGEANLAVARVALVRIAALAVAEIQTLDRAVARNQGRRHDDRP